jgi:RNA polymerase sigma-70 factor, ECF subfamily
VGAGKPLLYLTRNVPDETLVEGLRRGDVACYRQLYELYSPRLQRTLERLFRDAQLAQDAVQSTFLAVFRSVQQFDGRSTLLTWMTRIAIREAQRLAGRQSKARRLATGLSQAGEAPPAATGPVEREDLRILSELLDELSEEKRTALLLFEVEGFSVQEIADITGEPRGTVLARLSRTRAELREALRRRHDAAPALASATNPRKSKSHV